MKYICTTIAFLCMAGALACANGDELEALEHEVLRLAAGKAKITAAQAVEAASKEADGGRLVEVELDLKGETPVFEMEFLTEQGEKEITLDAVTGKVLEREDERPDTDEAAEHAAVKKALADSKATLAQAIDAAMSEVKDGIVVEAEVEVESGQLEFEVELLVGDTFKEVSLDAVGKVTGIEEETADGQAWSFDHDTAGEAPAGFRFGFTNPADGAATWSVARDADAPTGANVLKLEAQSRRRVFNVAIAERTSYRDVAVRTRIRADRGKEDQGGGPIWRCKDASNYYVCRINPLENNFRVYKVVDGKRTQLASAELETATDRWYEVRAVMVGDKIECFVDGKKHLEAADDAFMGPGSVGLWSKADASSSFDDVVVQAPRAVSNLDLKRGEHNDSDDDDHDDYHDD